MRTKPWHEFAVGESFAPAEPSWTAGLFYVRTLDGALRFHSFGDGEEMSELQMDAWPEYERCLPSRTFAQWAEDLSHGH